MNFKKVSTIVGCLCLALISGPIAIAEIGDELWSFPTGDVIFGSPTVDSSGNIYIGSLNGRVYSVDGVGNERWSVQTGDWIEASAALSPDETVVYIGSWDNNLYALDAESGIVQWTFATGSLIFSSPAVSEDGRIFFGGADGFIYALSPDGIALWEVFIGGEVDASLAIGPNGNLYAATSEGSVVSLDDELGDELWAFQVPVESGAEARDVIITSSCVLSGEGSLFVGCNNYFFYALNTDDGSLRWKYETGGEIEASPTLGIDGNLLVSSRDGYLYALGPSGDLSWRSNIGPNFYTAATVDEIGRIYVSSFIDNALSYLNLLSPDGEILQRVPFTGIIDSSVAISPEGRLYLGNNNGNLYAFSNEGRLSNSVWPKFRGNLASTGSIEGYVVPSPNKERIYNIALRGSPGGGENDIIAGFAIGGSGEKKLLVRAVGPGLEDLGVVDYLEDPIIRFYDSGGQFGTNDDWGASSSATILPGEMGRLGAFALEDDSSDSADLLTFGGGVYTAIVSNDGGEGGIALVEIYNGDPDDSESSLANVAMRGPVGTGDEVLIAGFYIEGNLPKRILLRAVGSGLAAQGVSGVLADTTLRLFRGPSVIESNDDWDAHPEKAQLESFMSSAGAFALEEGSGDSAMFVWLEPGLYTAIVSGKNDQTGIALVELYDLTGK